MNYPLLDVFWTMLEFFLWIMWFFVLFRVIGDIFRNHESTGWNKALWLILVLFVPFLGVLIYVIVHGNDMGRRSMARAEEQQRALQDYFQKTAGPGGGGSSADELAKLAELKEKGVLNEAEYQQAKAKILA